jgi:WD40 repeat protein
MIVTVLLLGVVVSTWQAIRATQAELEQGHLRQLAEAEQHKAEEAQGREVKQRQFAEAARQNEALLRQQAQAHELVARRTAYNSDMNLAQQALQLNNIGRAMEILNRHRPKPGEIDPRGWEWRFLWRSCQSDALFTLCHRPDEIFSVSFTHDGRYLAVGDEGSEVSVWELVSRKRVMSRKTGVDRQRIAFSPLTNLLAFSEKGSAGQYAVRLWNVEKGQGVRQWVIPGKGRELVFAKDGKSLAAWSEASAQSDERIFLWDVDSGRTLFETAAKRGGDAMGNLLALSEGAQTLAYGSTGGEVVLIDLATGREKSRLHVTDDLTMAVAISDDGRMLASAAGFADPVVKLWDLATGKVAAHLEGHRSYVNALAFSPDGRRLASASGDQTIRIWDWKERRSLTALRGHSSEVLAVTFSPDGQTLASGGKDWNVFIWNTTSNRNARGYELFPVHPLSWSFAGDGGSIIGLDSNGVVRSWATAGLQEHRRFEVLGTSNTSFALSKSGGLLAVGTQTGGVHVVHLLTDDEAGSFRAGSGSLKILGFGGEENFLLTLDQDRLVSQWDVRSGKRTHQWQIPEPFSRIQLNRAADFLATGGRDQLVLWRTTDGQRVWTAATGHESYQPAFSHDGKFVAVPNGKGFTMLFDTRNGAELMTLGGLLLGASSAAFSPDDQRLLIGGSGNEAVKMWDTELRQELLTLEGQGSFFGPPKFSPDGCVLASRSRKGLHFWRAPSWTDIAVAEAKENAETKPHGAKR